MAEADAYWAAPNNNIAFGKGNVRFYFRVAGVMLHGDEVLLHRADYEDFWSLPGGRVEMLERADEAIVRELQEELEVEARIERLLWVAENFFDFEGTKYHELGLYYLMVLPLDWALFGAEPFWRQEPSGIKILFCWFDLAELDGLRVNPAFLGRGLRSLPERVEHVVQVGS
jgi:ADP-ribose pyrophosphatase YjhB (NUDIX family)